MTEPVYRTGKICYLEIPAADVAQSAQFYQSAFGWDIRERGDGATAFDDTVGGVSGTWIHGRDPSASGIIIYIMAADAAGAAEAVTAAGGEIVRPVDPNEHEVFFHFRDPAGNVLGVYQQPGLAETEGQVG